MRGGRGGAARAQSDLRGFLGSSSASMAAAQRPPVVSESVGAAPSSGSSFPYPFNPYGSAAAAVAAPAAPAPAAAAVPVSSYEAMLAKTNAELGLQKPVKPPPGAPQKDLDAYYDALGEWEFNQQARQLQLSTEETAKLEKEQRSKREKAMTVRGCIERSGYFRSSILQKEGPLVPLFKWLDAEAVYYETDDDRKYYDKGSGSAYDYDSTSSAHAAPDFVEHFVVCLRANSNLPPTSASSPAPAAGFGMRIQAISPTAPFVVVQSEPPASAYGDVATHPLASHPLYREQLELQRQQAAMAAAASRQAAHVANRGSRNASIHAPPPAAAPTVPKTLQRGDHILAINGVSLRQLGLSYSDPQAGGEQANFAFAIAERLLGRLAAPGGWGVLLLVRRSRDFNRYVRQMDAAISGGSSSSSSSSSSASSSSSSVGLVRYHMPARPRWSFLLSELDVRAAAVSILPHERTGLRNFREPCAQWTRKCLIPELTSSLEQVIPQPAEMAAALESTFQRAMQLVNAISPLPPPSAFGASSSSSSSSSSSLALQIAIIRDLPALSATAHGYCSPLMFPHGKPNGSGVRPHLCTSGVGLPGSSSAVVSILEQQMVSLVEGMSKMPAQGRAGGIPDIFYAFYEPPKYDSDEDGEVELLDGEVEAPKEAVALDLDAEHLSQPSAAPAARAAASSSSSRSAASNQPSSSHAGHKRPREEASTIVLEDSEVRFPGNSTNEPEIIELDDD